MRNLPSPRNGTQLARSHGAARAPASDEAAFPPIEDYAAIGNCRTTALVSRQGSIDWLCLPHVSAPAIFAALLDRRRGGRFAVRPATPFVARRHYLGDTNVLETTFECETGTVRLIDCMSMLNTSGRGLTLDPQHEVLRMIDVTAGTVDLEIIYEPRPYYGKFPMHLRRRGALGWACQHRDQILILNADVPLASAEDGSALRTTVRLRAGDRRFLSLSYTRRDIAAVAPLGSAAGQRLQATLAWWQAWADRCRFQGPYRPVVVRSALALKLMTYDLSGAVVAAPTASLPESIGGVRNWDYRFCWLRDAALTLRAFTDLGYQAEGRKFVGWLLHATRLTWPELNILYDVHGETNLHERQIDWLEGYRQSRPVHIGNDAKDQLQLDVYGAVLLAVADLVMTGGRIDRQQARTLAGFGRTVMRRWREPDEGIWEFRGPRRHNTHSKMLCWVALDCLIRLHEMGQLRLPVEACKSERHAIRMAIERHGYNEQLDSYVGAFDGTEPDASLLLMPCYGYRSASDPRMLSTFKFIDRELGHDGLLYRYRPGSDGLPGAEGAFGICSFWGVDFLARTGAVAEAAERFRHLLSFANDVGLFAEEIDPSTGTALGNFPQAFTHVGLINAACMLARAGTDGMT